MNDFILWLRWALLAPASLAGIILGFIVGIFVNLQIGASGASEFSVLYLLGDALGGFLSSAIGVLIAAAIAPTQKKQVGLIIGCLCLLGSGLPYSISNSWKISKGEVIEWALVAGGDYLGVIAALLVISRVMVPKKSP